MKTKEQILDRNGFDFESFKFENEYSAANILLAMEEYAQQQLSTPEQLFPVIDGSTPHVCPVCCGRQYAPMGFYDGLSTAMNTELCRTCGGSGIIWRHEIGSLERKEESK